MELGDALKAEGVPKYDLARAEQGKKHMSRTLRRELARILQAPEAYFTNPDLDQVLFREPSTEIAPRLEGEIGHDAEDSETNDQDHGQSEL
jgi:hypothetical protein